MKHIKILSIFLTLLSINGYSQNSEKSKSTAYTIAYGSDGICLTNIEGTSKVRLTTGDDGYPAWSPDGKRIAMYGYHDGKKTWSIHTINSDGTNRKRLTHAKNKWDSTPSWSSDGKKIVFAREYKDLEGIWQYEIWIMNSDGSGQIQLKSLKGSNPFFTPDERIVFSSEFKDKNNGICIADVDGNNSIQLTDIEANEWHPKVSPDGTQIAFSSDRDGNREIYVMNIDGSNQKRLTNNNGPDGGPSWSPDGSQLIFLSHREEGNGIYMMNKDGSEVKKIASNGWQPAWLKIHQSNGQDKLPVLEGPYLGLKPPGLTPEVIAPGIVTTEEGFIGSVKFSPDMKEIYTAKKGGRYKDFTHLVIRYEDNKWQDESISDFKWPVFSKDGTIIYKGNKYRERTESGWSEFKSMGAPFDDKLIMGISLSDTKTIFFSHFDAPDRDGVISYSRFIDGKYEPSQKLGKEINNGSPLAHPYIAPNESYLIWDAVREGGYGNSDIYISFRQNDGSWGAVINMGAQINTKQEEGAPRVTPDGKYLTFWRGGSRVKEDGSRDGFGSPYWVDAQIIETLRPKSNLTLLSSEIPTDTALVFSPDFISTDTTKDFAITFSPEMDELFFTRRKPEGANEIFTSKFVDSKWSNPELAFLTTHNGWDFQPHINPKGDRLYFGSTRPLNDTIKSSGMHEWYSEKNDGEWRNPKPMEKLFLDRVVMYLKSSKNDNLYFTSVEKGGRAKDGGIYYSINENGQYKSVKKMGEVINSNGDWIAHSYIAPDESYIIYSSETNKNTDLFISFNLNGTWTESYSMGPKINTEQGESTPSVSPDGKYFFFSRSIEKIREDGSTYYLGNIYWVDFIKLKKELLDTINSN